MTAKTASINGVTRLHTFDIDIAQFKNMGGVMASSADASELGLKPGDWPDSFHIDGPIGTFVLHEILKDGSRSYRSEDGNCRFTIWND